MLNCSSYLIHIAGFCLILTDEKCLLRANLEENLAMYSSAYCLLSFFNCDNYAIISSSRGCRLQVWALLHPILSLWGLRLSLHSRSHLWYLHLHRPVLKPANPSEYERQRISFNGTLIWKPCLVSKQHFRASTSKLSNGHQTFEKSTPLDNSAFFSRKPKLL